MGFTARPRHGAHFTGVGWTLRSGDWRDCRWDGLNAHPEFAERAARKISELSGLPFRSHPNKFASLSAHDEIVFASRRAENAGIFSNEDCQRYSAGWPPGRGADLGELMLPENEPGSSIMPGR